MKLYTTRLTFADIQHQAPERVKQRQTRVSVVMCREGEFLPRVPMYERSG
jgi:hypothetical protein